ncbi:MAG TPA: DegT/DnrJ/EryC1/StrS family aminotransferase [Opitutaceae bacterium]|nr:DegT/DnrJ/EryC1/StrS family aminotransferase [Opitutaceae bacterium]
MNVPFLDLKAHHDPLRAEITAAINEVIDQNAFAGGPFVTKFEEDFAKYCKTKHALGVANGTDALWFALLGYGVGPGDEVITVPNSFIATAEAISFCGATPVFVDIDPKTYTMNPALIEAAITPKTKAIIPVHLYGQTADMDPIMEIARRRGLKVIEDACQAHGALYKGRPAGSIGDAGAFSFYPGKNLGAWGEAGGITTNDSALNDRMKTLRDHGQEKKYFHSVVGWNGRMDGIQGAVLKVKLKTLEKGNEARRAHAKRYTELLSGLDIVLPTVADYSVPVFHLFVIRAKNRDAIIAEMSKRGVSCLIHYPKPIHLQKAYDFLGLKPGSFPVTESTSADLLSLPMYPELTDQQLETVVRELRAVLGSQ